MKLTALIVFLLLGHGLFAQKKETIVIKTPTSCNHCKICETCGGKLETDLYWVKGIKVVEYNEETQTTTVTFKPKVITADKVRQEIAKLGFDADNVTADPKGYEQRDTCCKK